MDIIMKDNRVLRINCSPIALVLFLAMYTLPSPLDSRSLVKKTQSLIHINVLTPRVHFYQSHFF